MNMANNANKQAVKEYVVKVKGNENFCGIGAGGIQFANGTATTTSERMANWFREHKGYVVEEAKEAGTGKKPEA